MAIRIVHDHTRSHMHTRHSWHNYYYGTTLFRKDILAFLTRLRERITERILFSSPLFLINIKIYIYMRVVPFCARWNAFGTVCCGCCCRSSLGLVVWTFRFGRAHAWSSGTLGNCEIVISMLAAWIWKYILSIYGQPFLWIFSASFHCDTFIFFLGPSFAIFFRLRLWNVFEG